MEESTDICVAQNKIHYVDDVNILAELNSPDNSPLKRSRFVRNDDSSDEDATPVQRNRKRVQQFSESDTEKENVHTDNNRNEDLANKSGSESDNSDISVPFKSRSTKSRIQLGASSSDSDTKEHETMKNEEQQMRMKNKTNKLKQKFKGLLSSRTKHSVSQNLDDKESSEHDNSESEGSDNEMTSITNIKEKIKKSMTVMTSICDPDTSDEESNVTKKAPIQKQKKPLKSTKMIEAKPMRMSAKQAMENMQLIKSESNRMLREKAVSLPYHRPKALSLKDIMSRRKPAVASDGKALPIKMNEEQLKQYALQLEQRQKEMMELCKSESEEEEEDTAEPKLDENLKQPTPKNTENGERNIDTNIEGQCDNEVKDSNDFNADIKNNVSDEINALQPDSDIIASEFKSAETPETNTNVEKEDESINTEPNKNDSNTSIQLAYNDDSIEEDNLGLEKTEDIVKEDDTTTKNPESNFTDKTESDKDVLEKIQQVCSEQDSQLISLQYTENATEDSTVGRNVLDGVSNKNDEEFDNVKNNSSEQMDIGEDDKHDDFFSDDDVNMEDIDKIIENAEIMKDNVDNINSPLLVKDTLSIQPKLTGGPGMVIDLDSTDTLPKRSGIELLKERFTYFAKLKTPEELERQKEKTLKPGAQHLKLKQDLQEKIAEQRSLEWAKRLEEEKQLHQEMDAILDDGDDADDSIEKIEAELDEQEEKEESDSESEEEELVEDDIEIKDKPRKHNPMLDDEAVESDDENDPELEKGDEANDDVEEGDDIVEDDNVDESSEDEESSESEEEEEQTSKPKKGRIIKAFEDSDDEDDVTKLDETNSESKDIEVNQNQIESAEKDSNEFKDTELIVSSCEVQGSSQDDVIQLAQRHKSASDDLFTSQESTALNLNKDLGTGDEMLGTQTFSISSAKPSDFLCPSQPCHDPNLNGITDGFSQSVIGSQLPTTQSSQSQPMGEDILALCTGNFYDNEFVSESNENLATEPVIDTPIDDIEITKEPSREIITATASEKINLSIENNSTVTGENKPENSEVKKPEESVKKTNKDEHLRDILDELDDPEFDKPKQNIYFTGAQKKDVSVESSQMKKRLIIDSDDETNETNVASDEGKKKKKLKKKKLEKRALQISDDEDDDEEDELGLEDVDDVSDLDDDTERVVEYDSEENEIEVKPDKPKKKRKGTDFFEQEAELTSEDEWVGSGDEDEHGLDRMEREEGDDDVFHQGKLRKELGQIHMRDVLDQDKREVRLLQELLFEDGDLGGGHRQRKFRWRNEGDDEAGTVPDDFTDTQEEEFESEEQWRKQRHEREVFLRQMQNQHEEQENANVTVNRTTIIKANLISKSMSALLMEANQSKTEVIDSPVVPEKKPVKDVPSPKKAFTILQQNYHSSLLTRGRGALARLATLATPLAADDDAPKIGSLASRKRNFVFAALTQEEEKPKVTIKRKADINLGTPKLVKKMRTEEKQSHQKSSLLDHFNT